MGRLLKKKIPTGKKKKPDDEKNSSLSPVKSSGAGRSATGMQQKKSPSGTALPKTGVRAYIGKASQFLREVKAELKKVTWPSRKQTVGSTVVVIIVVMVIAFFLGIVDIGLSTVVRTVLQ